MKIIVDIGCGSGKFTSLLKETMNCDKVIGIDIKQDMIDFANDNFGDNKIEFFQQDISLDWNQLSQELKSLEGKVSLVYTNYAIHWLKEKGNAIRNIFRLLSSGGKFFARVVVVPYPMKDSPIDSDYNAVKQFLKIQTKEEQFNDWIKLLNENGLTVEKSELSAFSHYITHEIFQNS